MRSPAGETPFTTSFRCQGNGIHPVRKYPDILTGNFCDPDLFMILHGDPPCSPRWWEQEGTILSVNCAMMIFPSIPTGFLDSCDNP
jgi:hypothetical protein